MRAAVLATPGRPLEAATLPDPSPGPGEVLLRVEACGVCRTDLHIADGELAARGLPRVLGHQVVGVDVATGRRLGVPWLGGADGTCRFCRSGRENLCDAATFTGLDRDGGFAELCVAREDFCLPLPAEVPAAQLAPLLCGGLIGFRALRMAGAAPRLGLIGFGSAAHVICQVACAEGREVHAVTRPGDEEAQALARSLGAARAYGSDALRTCSLDAAIVFAPVGALVPEALRAVDKGGAVICAGIHMSDLPAMPYALLWGERTLRSVANLTRADGHAFFAAIAGLDVRTHVTTYPLDEAARALDDLRAGRITGSAVVVP